MLRVMPKTEQTGGLGRRKRGRRTGTVERWIMVELTCSAHTHTHTGGWGTKKNIKKKAMMKHKYFERQDGWYRLYGRGASNAEGPRSNLTGKVIDSKRKVSSPLDVVF